MFPEARRPDRSRRARGSASVQVARWDRHRARSARHIQVAGRSTPRSREWEQLYSLTLQFLPDHMPHRESRTTPEAPTMPPPPPRDQRAGRCQQAPGSPSPIGLSRGNQMGSNSKILPEPRVLKSERGEIWRGMSLPYEGRMGDAPRLRPKEHRPWIRNCVWSGSIVGL